MATTTFSGPIKAGTINNTTGTTVGTNVATVVPVVLFIVPAFIGPEKSGNDK